MARKQTKKSNSASTSVPKKKKPTTLETSGGLLTGTLKNSGEEVPASYDAPPIEELLEPVTHIPVVGWNYTFSYFNNPFKVVRKLIRDGLYSDVDIVKYVRKWNNSPLTGAATKTTLCGSNPTDALDLLFNLYRAYKTPEELFQALQESTFAALTEEKNMLLNESLLSATMELTEFTNEKQEKDLLIGIGLILMALDGPCTLVITATKSQLTGR